MQNALATARGRRYELSEPLPQAMIDRFPEYSPVLLQLLWNRGMVGQKTTTRQLETLLHPDFDAGLHDPMLVPGLPEALERIRTAIEAKEQITIYGDYDADGVPATALLYDALRQAGARVDHFIPAREEDGYGLSNGPIERLAGRGTRLIVTVDCGIRSVEAVEYARSLGIEVIVTDHHKPGAELPACTVVHPGLPGSKYPNPQLCGAGVAYKLVTGIVGAYPNRFGAGYLKWALDLVGIATIADMVPLTGENRVLAHYGLVVLRRTKRPGLLALYRVASLDPERITPVSVGFAIAPRLNAPGRMTTAEDSLELLLATDDREARRLALELQRCNLERQELTAQAVEEAGTQIEALGEQSLSVVSGAWAAGVAGIAASKLMEKYGRSVIVLCEGEDGLLKGSARSVEGIDITELLELCKDRLLQYGGHARAAGLSLRPGELEEFRRQATALAAQRSAELPERVTRIDLELDLARVDRSLWDDLERLAPYGVDNPEPLFLGRAEVVSARRVGNGDKHLKLRLRDGEVMKEAIGFGLAERGITEGDQATFTFCVQENHWNGTSRIELLVRDIWRNEPSEASQPGKTVQ